MILFFLNITVFSEYYQKSLKLFRLRKFCQYQQQFRVFVFSALRNLIEWRHLQFCQKMFLVSFLFNKLFQVTSIDPYLVQLIFDVNRFSIMQISQT
eukprot:UN08107